MCGMPLYSPSYVNNRRRSKWLPRSEPIEPPGPTTLQLLNKTIVNKTTVRHEFNLTGPSHMRLFIKPYEFVKLTNWSFAHSYLDNPPAAPLPLFIYFTYGSDSSPLNFFLEFWVSDLSPCLYSLKSILYLCWKLQKLDGDFDVPMYEMGVSGHYVLDEGDKQSQQFAASFPKFTILTQWPALYQRFIF